MPVNAPAEAAICTDSGRHKRRRLRFTDDTSRQIIAEGIAADIPQRATLEEVHALRAHRIPARDILRDARTTVADSHRDRWRVECPKCGRVYVTNDPANWAGKDISRLL